MSVKIVAAGKFQHRSQRTYLRHVASWFRTFRPCHRAVVTDTSEQESRSDHGWPTSASDPNFAGRQESVMTPANFKFAASAQLLR